MSDEALMSLVNQPTEACPFGFGGSRWKQSRTNFSFGWYEMNLFRNQYRDDSAKIPVVPDFHQAANDICEKALNDAKGQLHPLLQNVELSQLRKRAEFTRAFKLALAQRIAQRLAVWQPGLDAVFQFEESWIDNRNAWDGSIHLLVKVPRLSNTIKTFGKRLDQHLTSCLKQLGWSRFRKHQSILEVQQVTHRELRHGVGYGAMFCAVYSAPVKVWPPKRTL